MSCVKGPECQRDARNCCKTTDLQEIHHASWTRTRSSTAHLCLASIGDKRHGITIIWNGMDSRESQCHDEANSARSGDLQVTATVDTETVRPPLVKRRATRDPSESSTRHVDKDSY